MGSVTTDRILVRREKPTPYTLFNWRQTMIIQSHRKPDLLLADMTFWIMTINQPATEIYKNYKVLCPTIYSLKFTTMLKVRIND